MSDTPTRHEFLTLREPYYDGVSYGGGIWYCACGRWQYDYASIGTSWGDREVRRRTGQREFLAHLKSLEVDDE